MMYRIKSNPYLKSDNIVPTCSNWIYYWLVVDLPLWKNMSSSVGMMTFPTEWKDNPNVPNHQPKKASFAPRVISVISTSYLWWFSIVLLVYQRVYPKNISDFLIWLQFTYHRPTCAPFVDWVPPGKINNLPWLRRCPKKSWVYPAGFEWAQGGNKWGIQLHNKMLYIYLYTYTVALYVYIYIYTVSIYIYSYI